MKKFNFSILLIVLVLIVKAQVASPSDPVRPVSAAVLQDSNWVQFRERVTSAAEVKNLEPALVYGYKALDLARRKADARLIDSIQGDIRFCYVMLSGTAAKHFDYLHAFQYHIRLSEVDDSMVQAESNSRIASLQSEFAMDAMRLHLQIDSIQKRHASLEHVLAAQEERESRNLMICLSVAVLLLLTLFFLFPGYLVGKALTKAHSLKPADAKEHVQATEEKARPAIDPVKIEKEISATEPQKAASAEVISLKQSLLALESRQSEQSDSMRSARKIQESLFADTALLKKNLPEFFIFDKPSELLSGDFYWAREAGTGLFYLCVADSKGHGTAGALRSMLFMALLEEALTEKKITSPELIFGDVHEKIIRFLNPERALTLPKEGMDAVLCMLDLKGGWLRFCCANNPLWLIRNAELKEFTADERTVGRMEAGGKPFKLQTLGLRKGDCIYLFSNGFVKQTNAAGEKFGSARLQALLLGNSTLPMEQQHKALTEALTAWQGHATQIDDILVMGLRV